MNEKQKAWLEAYIESGDAVKAVEMVYTDVQPQSRATKASHLKARLADEIDKHGREQYKKEVPLMMNVIKELALNAKQDAVRLKSADTWLSRAGHDAALQVEVKETATHEQLLERLKIATTGIDPKLLAGVLPPELTNLLTKESKDNEQTEGNKEGLH